MKAQDRIHRQLFEPTDSEFIYGLYMDAHGDPELAMEAKTHAIRLRQKIRAEALGK